MEPGELLAIWLHDDAAKVFLGIQGAHPVSRWVVVCKVQAHTAIGVWVEVQRLEERRPATVDEAAKTVVWQVTPPECVIRYDYMITAQRLKGAEPPDDPRPTPGVYL